MLAASLMDDLCTLSFIQSENPAYVAPATGLPLQTLSPLERVSQQFVDQGIVFEHAIALIPSNPAFIASPGRQVIMPTGNHHRLALVLQQQEGSLTIAGRCTRAISLEAVDSSGQLVGHYVDKSFTKPSPSHRLLPCQTIRIDNLAQIEQIQISARTPFTLERIHLGR